jgi:hypothetical protein
MFALSAAQESPGWFICAAPTFGQAREIFWHDLKILVPGYSVARVSETLLDITLKTGTRLSVRGMDRPERIEGPPIDGIVLDEYANMKKETWDAHVRPALSTPGRLGWAWLIGVPEGRNHYYHIAQKAKADKTGIWDFFTWFSSDIMDPEEIAELKARLDARTYAQECEGAFQDFLGRAYYPFTRERHAVLPLKYHPDRDLIFCFDFNVSPGVAAVCQESPSPGTLHQNVPTLPDGTKTTLITTCAIGEVWIPDNSNTPAVCNKLAEDWKDHKGRILAYGDATGGAKGTSQTEGTDWELIYGILKSKFGGRFHARVPRANPKEKARVNAVNSRLQAADGTVGLLVDQDKCPHLVEDLEGVTLLEGGSGEIDKKDKKKSDLSHISDALGYYIEKAHPVRSGPRVKVTTLAGAIRG